MELVVDKWNEFQKFYQGCLDLAGKKNATLKLP
jgi:hypothetical protein